MPQGFAGFPKQGIAFFRSLARNNNREWFLPRKEIYEHSVKAPMAAMVEALNLSLRAYAPEYVTDPGKAIYRIYRDVRFSANKTPYKEHIAASFKRRGMEKHASAGYYFSISHKEIEVGGGIYMPTPEALLAIRGHLAENHEEFRRLSAARPVRSLLGEVQGEQLSRVPKGFCAEHEAADLLKYKQWLLFTVLGPEIATGPKLFAEVEKRFRAMAPWIEFLNRPLLASARKPPRFNFV